MSNGDSPGRGEAGENRVHPPVLGEQVCVSGPASLVPLRVHSSESGFAPASPLPGRPSLIFISLHTVYCNRHKQKARPYFEKTIGMSAQNRRRKLVLVCQWK